MPFVLNVGAPGDEEFVDRFHDPQRAGGHSYRWSTSDSAVLLPGLEWNTAQTLTLRLSAGRRPLEMGPPQVVVSVNGRKLGVASPGREAADFTFEVPRLALSPQSSTSVAIEVPPFRAPDGRALGVALEEVRLERRPTRDISVAFPPLGVAGLWILSSWILRAFLDRLTKTGAVRWTAYLAALLALAMAAAFLRYGVCRFAWQATLVSGALYALACEIPPWKRAMAEGVSRPVSFLSTLGIVDPRRRVLVETSAVAVLLVHFALGVLLPLRSWGPKDLALYREAGIVFREGRDPYDIEALRGRFGDGASDRVVFAFTNPPSAAVLYAPLALVSLKTATVLWRTLNVAFAALSGILVWSATRPWAEPMPRPFFFVLVLTASEPVAATLRIGQVGLLVLLLLALALWGFGRGKALWAATGVAVATALKVLPGFVLLYLCYRRHWRIAFATVAAGALLLLGALTLGGVAPWVTWFGRVLPAISAPVAYCGNQSIAGFLLRAAGESPMEPPLFNYTFNRQGGFQGEPERLLAYGLALAVVAACSIRFRRSPTDPLRRQLEFATMIPLMLLLAPLVWEFYLAWLTIPILVISVVLASRPIGASKQAGLVAMVALAWSFMQYDAVETYRRPGWPVVLMSLGLFGNLLLLLASFLLLGRPGGEGLCEPKRTAAR